MKWRELRTAFNKYAYQVSERDFWKLDIRDVISGAQYIPKEIWENVVIGKNHNKFVIPARRW